MLTRLWNHFAEKYALLRFTKRAIASRRFLSERGVTMPHGKFIYIYFGE